MATLHRIYRDVKKQVKTGIEERTLRRTGTALVITTECNSERVLLGRDVSTPRLDLGKSFGSVSLPMGYSKREGVLFQEKRCKRKIQIRTRINRLLQLSLSTYIFFKP